MKEGKDRKKMKKKPSTTLRDLNPRPPDYEAIHLCYNRGQSLSVCRLFLIRAEKKFLYDIVSRFFFAFFGGPGKNKICIPMKKVVSLQRRFDLLLALILEILES